MNSGNFYEGKSCPVVVQRALRWSENLPESEPIPVSESEVEEFAESCEVSIRSIVQGYFEFRGHRVVVL